MENLSVPFQGAKLDMTVAEARQLMRQLGRALDDAAPGTDSMSAPDITEDGFLIRNAMYIFFGQMDIRATTLVTRVSKLHTRIVLSSPPYSDRFQFKLKCSECGQLGIEHGSIRGDLTHPVRPEFFGIEVVSLKAYAMPFMNAGLKGVGEGMTRDLNLLLDYL